VRKLRRLEKIMAEGQQSCGMESHKEQQQRQDAEIRDRLGRIGQKILVMSGKGGVGKSSVAAFLALFLARRGKKVGLMDVDLHGPSIPRLLGLTQDVQLSKQSGKALPVTCLPNLHVISIESLMGENKDAATIWRGPIKIGVIRQFISDIDWPDLDFLVIDSPPGTGDEPLTVAQTIPDARALIVTTPQEISLADVRKSVNFCKQVNMRILGIVENMSGLTCPHCGGQIDLFRTNGARGLATKEGIELLGTLPIDPEVVLLGDQGELNRVGEKSSTFSQAFDGIVEAVLRDAGAQASQNVPKEEPKEAAGMNKQVFAVPVVEGKLCAHFGHCDQFALVETEDGKIKGTNMHTPPPHEPGVLPKWLHEMGAHIIIAGGMGSRAQGLFQENGIQVVTGAPMDAPEALVNQYLAGMLITGANVCDH
jgi:Mrp family chromosome partitioning ATPase/predicted Fe-Mo cluster-binding NifX family protein